MIVKTNLEQIQDELSPEFDKVSLRSQGPSAFLHLANKERAVEISECEEGLWLELWERGSLDEDAPLTMTVATSAQAVQEARKVAGIMTDDPPQIPGPPDARQRNRCHANRIADRNDRAARQPR